MTLETKDPDVPKTYAIDWEAELIVDALREQAFDEGDVVRAQIDTGWYYECTTAGRTARHYPQAWPRAEAETVQDGSLTWTCRHPDSAAVPTVSSAAWTLPTGLDFDSQSEDGRTTEVTVSGGTDGEDYDVLCRMTPSSGNVLEQTITIQVRAR